MMDVEQRSQELKAMHWKQIQKAAIAVGLDKPEDQTWEEFAVEVARFEASLSEPQAEPEALPEPETPVELSEPPAMPLPPKIKPEQPEYNADLIQRQAEDSAALNGELKPAYATDFYERSGIPYCLQCGEKYLAVDGIPVCPEKREGCDRNQSVEAI